MKARVKPGRTKVVNAAATVAANNEAVRAVEALTAHLRDGKNVPEPRLWDYGDFSENEVVAINLIARKQAKVGTFDEKAFVKAMDRTEPVLARPRMTDKPLDLLRTLAVPEISESLWPEWNARTGRRGRDPGYFSKALLVTTAALGASAHFIDNHDDLVKEKGRQLHAVFSWVERTGAAATGRRPQPFGEKSYQKALEQITLVVDPINNDGALSTDRCVATNLALMRSLADLHPEVGLRLGIDGMLIKGEGEASRQAPPRAGEGDSPPSRERNPTDD